MATEKVEYPHESNYNDDVSRLNFAVYTSGTFIADMNLWQPFLYGCMYFVKQTSYLEKQYFLPSIVLGYSATKLCSFIK